jgi:hypothetical protein
MLKSLSETCLLDYRTTFSEPALLAYNEQTHYWASNCWNAQNLSNRLPVIKKVICALSCIKKMIIISGLAILRLEYNGPPIMEFDIFV